MSCRKLPPRPKRLSTKKQEALAHAQKEEQEKKNDSMDGEEEEDASEDVIEEDGEDEAEDGDDDDDDDEEPISEATKRKARDARKEKIAEEANAKLKKKQALQLV